MVQKSHKALFIVSLFVIGLMVLALSMAFGSDYPKLVEIFHHIHPEPLIVALLCMAVAYLAFTLSFNGLFEMTPHRVPFPRFFSIMFISATVNFIISSGGMSSIAIRSLLLKQEKVPYSVTIPLSFAQNMIFNLVLSCVCFGGLVYLRQNPLFLAGPRQTAIAAFMIILLVVVVTMLLTFFNTVFRRWFLRQILRMGNWVNLRILRRNPDNRKLVEIRNNLETTIQFVHRGGIVPLLVVLFWVAMDWLFTALCLFYCFRAVGISLSMGLLLVGFTIFFLTSNFNPVPAGLGISESLLAFIFKGLGVGFESSLVASILFRFVFFLIPLAVSTALYLDIIRSFLKNQGKAEIKPNPPTS